MTTSMKINLVLVGTLLLLIFWPVLFPQKPWHPRKAAVVAKPAVQEPVAYDPYKTLMADSYGVRRDD
jgi:hypothetical protein